jgi:beta-galactosidase/beta-glucuronidase
MVRKDWMSLNGLWQFAAAKEGDEAPIGRELAEQILVPYPMESALSGIMRHEDRVWYRRTFDVPKEWTASVNSGQVARDVLLHLDAVNWESTVYLNGTKLGTHKGGYDAFGFNITRLLNKDGPNELIVGVVNTPDLGNHARGKQTMRPGGIFYTPASGIWQTVWIEPVQKTFIERIHVEPNIDTGEVKITGRIIGKKTFIAIVQILDGDKVIVNNESGKLDADTGITVKIPNAKLWSPESPFLYGLRVTLSPQTKGDEDGQDRDAVESYFGMRKIALGKDEKGILRPMLNNQFVFQVGPLDQGYWPDGIYTAPTDEALKSDIEITKKLGFNMTRKHVKVEPERWYYWADKLGLLVWQDMPAMRNTPDAPQKTQFEHELDRLIEGRGNHPSIIQWVVFN